MFELVGRRLALTYVKNVASKLEVFELDGKKAYDVPLPAPGSASEVIGVEDDDEAYFSFESFVHPPEIHKLSMKTGKTDVVYRTSMPVDPSRFTTTQVFATSRDGTKIPMFVLAPKDLPIDGRAPTLLNGYGGFSRHARSEVFDDGLPVARARRRLRRRQPARRRRIRRELAPRRHAPEQAKRVRRLHRVGRVLDSARATRKPDKLVIHGRSNGGLLVGAAMTQRPELFRVVLCGVPLLDMVRYHLFGSGKTWIEEYGSADDPKTSRRSTPIRRTITSSRACATRACCS